MIARKKSVCFWRSFLPTEAFHPDKWNLNGYGNRRSDYLVQLVPDHSSRI